MIKQFLFFSLLLLSVQAAVAQSAKTTLRGKVTDSENNSPVADASVVLSKTGKFTSSDKGGAYSFDEIKAGKYSLVVTKPGFLPAEIAVDIRKNEQKTVDVTLLKDQTNSSPEDIPTITLDQAESETEGAGEVANLLHASRDVFQNISGYGWSPFRFRERGYDSENFPLYLNGVNVQDPETGMTFFGEFGGLNDVLRNRESSVGLDAAEFGFTGIGGATRIDTRASVQRKQIRASYASTNRNYRNRIMLTMNTGLMPHGWAVSVSGSRRWAQEGYIPGTFFDGYSYFISVDKKVTEKSAFNLTVFAAPTKRGRAGDTFQEAYDLAGTHYYNPYWGYQNGDKRNASVASSNQPMAILRYDWTPNAKTAVTVASNIQAGKQGFTRLEWFNATNPNPDYNRRLPSSLENPELAAEWAQKLRENESLRQLDWEGFYDSNRHNTETVQNAEGIAGNNVTGHRSVYVVENQRSDSREVGANINIRHQLTNRIALQGGADNQWYLGQNFKVLDDLLGGDYWLDVNRYAYSDFPGNPDAPQNNALHPNNLIHKGERFGYDYNENIRRSGVWGQTQINLKHFQLFAAGEWGHTALWRTGNVQNGIFKDNSLGDSEKFNWNTWGAKAGITYKMNGRNYLYANGFSGTRAPEFRDVFISPRTRNQTISGPVETYKTNSVEGGYILRAPRMRARLTGYLTDFKDEIETYMVFSPSQNEFGTINLRGVNKRHMGVEFGVEAKPVPSWVFTGAASIGRYQYNSRPLMTFTGDNYSEPIATNDTIYLKNFYVPRTPQAAATLGVKYESRHFWFAGLSFNWRDQLWYQIDPSRRSSNGVEGVQVKDSDVWNTIIDQKKADAAYTIDFYGGKSWRFQRKYFININVGINNILNNQDIIQSGRDSYLTAFKGVEDIRQYSTELIYAPGLNYFVSLAFRM